MPLQDNHTVKKNTNAQEDTQSIHSEQNGRLEDEQEEDPVALQVPLTIDYQRIHRSQPHTMSSLSLPASETVDARSSRLQRAQDLIDAAMLIVESPDDIEDEDSFQSLQDHWNIKCKKQ